MNRDRVRIALAQSLGKGGGLVGAPVVHDPENASRLSIRSATHHVVDQATKWLNAGLRLNPADHPPRLDIECCQIRYSTMANVFVFEAHAAASAGRHGRVAPLYDLDARFLVGANHEVVGAEGLIQPYTL